MNICQTFSRVSQQTWKFLEVARGVRHQPLEETITDNNIIEIKALHPRDVITTTFSKRQEAKTGADWEWWFTNSATSSWFGVRVQAKILKLASNRYEALHYKSQTSVLIADAAKNKLYPLYCFYSHWLANTAAYPTQCGTYRNTPESYGCSLVDAYTIDNIKTLPASDSLASIMAIAFPLSCLVCCHGTRGTPSSGDLPTRVRKFLHNVIRSHSVRQVGDVPELARRPPDYVIATMRSEGDFADPDDANLAGVMVFVESNE